jgi:hypothetical protein
MHIVLSSTESPTSTCRRLPAAQYTTPGILPDVPDGVYRLTGGTILQPCRGALKRQEAAEYIGCGLSTLWKLTALGEIGRTPFGTYPIAELDRYLSEHTEREEQ